MVQYFVVFSRCGGISCDEDDGLIGVKLEHAVVRESGDTDDRFENHEEEMLWQKHQSVIDTLKYSKEDIAQKT